MNGLSTLEIDSLPKKKAGKSKVKIYFLLILFIIGAGTVGYFLFYEDADAVPPPAPLKKPVAVQTDRKPADTLPQGVKNESSVRSAQEIPVPKSGNLGGLTELIAKREELKLKKEVETLRKQIHDLTAPEAPANPAAKTGTVRDPLGEEREKAEIAARLAEAEARKADADAREAEKKRSSVSRIQSIQGVNGSLTARILNGHGDTASVRKGSAWAGGIVEDISRQGITLNKNGIRAFIPYAVGE